jgi:Raf kinase inhibitor-like YbhB/YbcL family protein
VRLLLLVLAFSEALSAQSAAAKPSGASRGKQRFFLTAGGLTDGGVIPRRFACNGAGVSLPLSWSGEPEGTQSFALIVDDPDARNFTHWLLWDIPAPVHSLAEGAEPNGVSGKNDFGKSGYGAPCPPEGQGPHLYSFRLFALDVPSLEIKAGAHRDVLDKALKKHVLGKVEYRLQYGR